MSQQNDSHSTRTIMRGKTYCCDATRHLYEDYYANHSGSGIPVFVGRRFQRGHGLAQTIGGLFKRYVIPFVAPHAKRIGKQILGNVAKTGMEVVSDVVSGKSAKEAIKERALSGIKRTVGDIVSQSPFNFGQDNAAKRHKPQQSTVTKKRKKKKVTVKPGRRRNDIFG